MHRLAILAPVLCGGAAVADAPFSDLGYEAALAQAKEQGRILVVDATASWCPPCKRMEKEAWPSEEVRGWFAEHGLAIQIDVDAERERAQALRIEAMPTMIAFKDGEEFDRIVGFRDAPSLLGWLEDVRAGRRSVDLARERSTALSTSDDVDARYDVARELLRAGDHEAALAHFVWLWKNTRDVPKYGGVRLSFMLVEIQRLCQAYEPAREAFEALLDSLDTDLSTVGSRNYHDWAEWFALSDYLEDDARVLAAFERMRDEDGRLEHRSLVGFLATYVPDQFFDVLMEHGRFRDAALLVPDIQAKARTELENLRRTRPVHRSMAPEMQESLIAYERTSLQDSLSKLHVAALVVGRDEQAAAIAGMLLAEYDDSDSRMRLVGEAERAGVRGDDHARWLAEAMELGNGADAQGGGEAGSDG